MPAHATATGVSFVARTLLLLHAFDAVSWFLKHAPVYTSQIEASERQVGGRCPSRPRCLGLGYYVATVACAWSVSPAYIDFPSNYRSWEEPYLLAILQKYHTARLRRGLATDGIFWAQVLGPVLQRNGALV